MTLPPGVGLEPLFDFIVVLLFVLAARDSAPVLDDPRIPIPASPWNPPVDNARTAEGAAP